MLDAKLYMLVPLTLPPEIVLSAEKETLQQMLDRANALPENSRLLVFDATATTQGLQLTLEYSYTVLNNTITLSHN